jgi:hypothetical protein
VYVPLSGDDRVVVLIFKIQIHSTEKTFYLLFFNLVFSSVLMRCSHLDYLIKMVGYGLFLNDVVEDNSLVLYYY